MSFLESELLVDDGLHGGVVGSERLFAGVAVAVVTADDGVGERVEVDAGGGVLAEFLVDSGLDGLVVVAGGFEALAALVAVAPLAGDDLVGDRVDALPAGGCGDAEEALVDCA